MPTREYICDLDAPLEAVWAFHDDIGALFKLTPPQFNARLIGPPEPMRQGTIFRIVTTRFGVSMQMNAEIVAYEPPRLFRDRQVRGNGPFRSWEHTHRFDPLSESRTRLTDHVVYELPFGPLGRLADLLFVRRELDRMFAYRHKVTQEQLASNTPQSSSASLMK